MSPRAAWRLESLGFTQVSDYVAGKADWAASGLPLEGTQASVPRAGEVARRDVPTCRLTERLGEVHQRVKAAGWDTCLVVSETRVVLGRLRERELQAGDDTLVEAAMESGPTTFRPDVPLDELVERLGGRHVGSTVITTSDGRLVGLLVRSDAEHRINGNGG